MASESRSTNYWPGFVDALSNMVLAMVFIVLVLSLAVSMYSVIAARATAKRMAMEQLGFVMRKPAEGALPPQAAIPSDSAIAAKPGQTAHVRVKEARVPASTGSHRVEAGQPRPDQIVVEFEGTAVAMSDAGVQAFEVALQPMARWLQSGHAEIQASAPAGYLTDNQQMSFYRVMAVRNLLLARGMTPQRIHVRVSEKPLDGSFGVVRVAFSAQVPVAQAEGAR